MAPLETFTILTTAPNEIMAPIHNRMPVIVAPEDCDQWLDPGNTAKPPVDLLQPYPAERMRAWPVSDRVGNVRNNDSGLQEPVPPDSDRIVGRDSSRSIILRMLH